MRKELVQLLKNLDAAAARLNAGLAAVALVLLLAVGLALTVRLGEAAVPAMLDAAMLDPAVLGSPMAGP